MKHKGPVIGQAMTTQSPLNSVGLGGDGDEWAAVARIEAEFGVTLAAGNAPGWWTAGDLYAALLAALPSRPDGGTPSWEDPTWRRFAVALSAETGVDPLRVAPQTRLLAIPLWELAWRWLQGRRGG